MDGERLVVTVPVRPQLAAVEREGSHYPAGLISWYATNSMDEGVMMEGFTLAPSGECGPCGSNRETYSGESLRRQIAYIRRWR